LELNSWLSNKTNTLFFSSKDFILEGGDSMPARVSVKIPIADAGARILREVFTVPYGKAIWDRIENDTLLLEL